MDPTDASVAALLVAATARLAGCSERPRLDAELLLGHVLGADRTALVAHPAAQVAPAARAAFEALVERRAAGVPVAYLRGVREFHGLALATDERALVPRPETELLVDAGIALVRRALAGPARPAGARPPSVVDVGTGSGAIVLAIAVELRRRGLDDAVRLDAVDLDPAALALARENAVAHALADRVAFHEADLVPAGVGPWTVLCANLPYVPTAELDAAGPTLAHEPRRALDGGPDGLAVVRRLLPRLPAALETGGTALLEIGAAQGAAVAAEVAAALPGWRCSVEPDLAGRPRLARIAPP